MSNRYSKNVLETDKSIRKNYSKLPAVIPGQYAQSLSVYTDKGGYQAVIPAGWTVSPLESENCICSGLVLYYMPIKWAESLKNMITTDRLNVMKLDCDQIVWIPVSLLDSNGTLDGLNFSERFGRRNYQKDDFSNDGFHEEPNQDLFEQINFIKTYGGFYITRYNISEDVYGKFRSVKGHMPITDISIDVAKEYATAYGTDKNVKSHLPFGSEYDSILEWFIKSGARIYDEIVMNSSEWGNYAYNSNHNNPRGIIPTGSIEEYCSNNIYDFAGNVSEWSQEKFGSSNHAMRGGWFYYSGDDTPVCYRDFDAKGGMYKYAGLRAAIYFK